MGLGRPYGWRQRGDGHEGALWQITQLPARCRRSTLELSRNCTYNDYLTITSDNVIITAYGSGSPPVISLNHD